MSKRPSSCAYCGIRKKNLTQDHVIASTLRGGRKYCLHPVVVPACEQCQKKYDKENAYFRTCTVLMLNRHSHPVAERLLTSDVTSHLQKDQRLAKELMLGSRLQYRRRNSGLITGMGMTFPIYTDRLNLTIEKLVRGLYYYKSRVRFPESQAIRIWPGNGFHNLPSFQTLLEKMSKWEDQRDDVFLCRYVRDSHNPDISAWYFVFYRQLGFFAWTEPKDRPESHNNNGGGLNDDIAHFFSNGAEVP